jgi:hypothetical protein
MLFLGVALLTVIFEMRLLPPVAWTISASCSPAEQQGSWSEYTSEKVNQGGLITTLWDWADNLTVYLHLYGGLDAPDGVVDNTTLSVAPVSDSLAEG